MRSTNSAIIPSLEVLECRHVLADVTLTIITHGLRFANEVPWVLDMATAINERNHYGCQDRIRNSVVRLPFPATARPERLEGACPELFLLHWDLFQDSPANSNSVAGRFVEIIKDSIRQSDVPVNLHFIGHSRGAYVNYDILKRLGQETSLLNKIDFVQMTVLDAQEGRPPLVFGDGPLDANPGGIVDWTDNYYELESVLEGFFLDRADVNIDLTEALVDWPLLLTSNHSKVVYWYHWTIDVTDHDDIIDGVRKYQEVPAVDSARRESLYGSLNVDLDKDGHDDLFHGGQKIGFHYSLGDAFGPRTLSGFGGLDLVFVIDTTISMKDDIEAAKNAASQIVNRVHDDVANVQIGIVTYRDYPVAPFGGAGDYPGRVELPLTSDKVAAINARAIASYLP